MLHRNGALPEDTPVVMAASDLHLQALASTPETEDAEMNSEDLHAFVYEKVGEQSKCNLFSELSLLQAETSLIIVDGV